MTPEDLRSIRKALTTTEPEQVALVHPKMHAALEGAGFIQPGAHPMTSAIEKAREAARIALEAEAGRFQSPVEYYVEGEVTRREIDANVEDYSADCAERQRRASWALLSNAALDAFLASLKASGLVIVPVEPTEGMLSAAANTGALDAEDSLGEERQARKVYAAMIAAAAPSKTDC